MALHTKFSIKIGSLAPDTFRVLEFSMTEAISECFTLHLQASCENGDIKYEDLIGKEATLKIESDDFPISHHGIVTLYNQYPDSSSSFGHDSFLYDITIVPHLSLLAYSTQNRIFQKKTVPEILQEVFKGHSLISGTHFRLNLSGRYNPREYTVQYNETDLAFVTRLMEHEGIFYYFDHSGDKDLLVLGDKLDAIKPIPNTPTVSMETETGLSHQNLDHVTSIRRTQKMVTGKSLIKDYNDRTPSVNVVAKASKPGQGEDYHFGSHVLTTSDAERIAQLRVEMHAAGKVRIEGGGICRDFRAGMRFELQDPHDHSFFAGKYTLIQVTHVGDQREGFEGDQSKVVYSNTFTCIPADTVFRPPLETAKPKISGVITAKVDGVEGKYAFLDEEGRYHAKLPFDLSDLKDGQASLPIRMSQPYGGPNYGMHFPIHNGNDLVISFIDGDVDRPIALGTVPNPSNGSPVNKRNNSESIIRTASGHQIKLDDKDGKTVIEITTKGKHVITLNDDADHKEIRVETTDGNFMVLDDKNKHISIGTPEGAHLIKLDNDKKSLTAETKYGHKLFMDDQAKSLALQTKDGHILKLDDDKKLLSLQDGKGKHVIQIDAGGSKIVMTTAGDFEIAAKGKLDITAKEINMEAKQGAINVKAAKDVVLDGMNVSAKGKQKVTLEATMDASIKGLNLKLEGTVNVESKAGVQNKVTGIMTNVEASAINTVKGSVVMIN